MSLQDDRFWLERRAVQYLDALDDGDLDAIADLWEQAAANPELARLLDELNQSWEEAEESTPGLSFAADQVRDLVQLHLPAALPTVQSSGPLVGSEVARRLEAEPEFRRLDGVDRVAHARLLADATPLPGSLAKATLTAWLRDLGADAGPRYIKLFRHVAILLDMARGQGETRLAAARPADLPRDDGGGTA